MQKLLFVLLLASCTLMYCTNPFEFRNTEEPEDIDNRQTDEAPTTVPRLFEKLKNAFTEKNVIKYMECLVDSELVSDQRFHFIPDQAVPEALFNGWNMNSERNYINRVFNENQTTLLNYIDQPGADFDYIDSVETRFFNYEIRLINTDTIVYRGKARMKLIRNALSYWSVYFWQDVRNDDNFDDTWSTLKAEKQY